MDIVKELGWKVHAMGAKHFGKAYTEGKLTLVTPYLSMTLPRRFALSFKEDASVEMIEEKEAH